MMTHRPVVERIAIWGTYCAQAMRVSCIGGFNQRPGDTDPGTVRRRLHGLRQSLYAAERELANKATNQGVVCRDAKSWALNRTGDPIHAEPGFVHVVSHRAYCRPVGFSGRAR